MCAIPSHNLVRPDACSVLTEASPSFQPLHHLLRRQHLAKREPKAPQPRLMLCPIRTPTRIPYKPSLISPIKRAPSRRIAAAIRHDATNNHPLNLSPFQHIAQIRIDERIIGILRYDAVVLCDFLNLGYEFPVLAACLD